MSKVVFDIPPPPAPPTSLPGVRSSFGANAATMVETSSDTDDDDNESIVVNGTSSSASHVSFRLQPHDNVNHSTSSQHQHGVVSVGMAANGGGGGGANSASMTGVFSPLSASASKNEVSTLRSKISELEYQLSKYEQGAEDFANHKEMIDSLRLERDVAKRNCEILSSNVETLKALSLDMATQLDQSLSSCKTLEEKLKCVDLKKELHDFEGADAMRKLYEGRLASLERALKSSCEANEALAKRFNEREIAQDARVAALEASKDAMMLGLMKENERLKHALNAATAYPPATSVTAAAGGGGSSALQSARPSIKDNKRAILTNFRAETRELRATVAAVNTQNKAIHATLSGQSSTHNNKRNALSNAILNLSIASNNLVSLDAARFRDPFSPERRQLAIFGKEKENGSAFMIQQPVQKKYQVEMEVDVDQLRAIDSSDFDVLLAQHRRRQHDERPHEVSSVGVKKEWCYVTDTDKAIRISMETI